MSRETSAMLIGKLILGIVQLRIPYYVLSDVIVSRKSWKKTKTCMMTVVSAGRKFKKTCGHKIGKYQFF